MGSPDIDERMAALTDEDWEYARRVADGGPSYPDHAFFMFSVDTITRGDIRTFVARLREKLDGLTPAQRKVLAIPAEEFLNTPRGTCIADAKALVELGFLEPASVMGALGDYEWGYRRPPEGRAALHLLGATRG